ncbi:MAG: DUF6049 family protein [Actinomycetota bacterium]
MFKVHAWLVLLTAAATFLATPAALAGQGNSGTVSGSGGPRLVAELVGFPISVGPADSLSVALEVENTGSSAAADLEVAIVIYRGVRNRSELSLSYDGRFGRAIASDTIAIEGTIEPGGSRLVEVAKPLGELDAFRNSTTDRAHPVSVVVRTGDVSSPPIDTHMIYFAKPPEKPLGVSLVVPLHAPSTYTDASRPDVVTTDTLERSVSGGRLDTIIRALQDYPALPVTLAPSGLLLSMLQDLSDGYVRTAGRGRTDTVDNQDGRALAAARNLETLRLLVAREATRLVATSYSPAPLPALTGFGLKDLAVTQLTEGRNVLKAEPAGLLRAQAMPGWLLPAGGDLDETTLAELQNSDSNRLILSARSLSDQSGLLSRGLPVKLEGGTGTATAGLEGIETMALVADAGLNASLAVAGELGAVQARQRFAAETATIHQESPGVVRAVVALAPLDWQIGAQAILGIFETAARAPWLVATTPDGILSQLRPPAGQTQRLATSEEMLKNLQTPPQSYFTQLQEAQQAIDNYAVIAPPTSELGALTRRLLIAESADWWDSRAQLTRGLAFARSIPTTVAAEMDLIRAPEPQTITLTSRIGVIPLSVGSALGYPVDVVIRLESDKLRFPGGNRIVLAKLRPPNQTIRVRAITQSSGTFPLRVRVLTPAGQEVANSLLTIRSTAYNVVALSITGGAAAFLVGWWAVGAIKRRIG